MNLSNLKKVIVTLDKPFLDQRPGTSGLRKSSKRFAEEHYLESFVEAILRTLPGVNGGVLVVGGDGRYGNLQAIETIIAMSVAHGIKKVITTVDGILSTPAASHLIRKSSAIGAIILSASHNPGGVDADFGVKVNGQNGGPAPESLTNEIYLCTKTLKDYKTISNLQKIDLGIPNSTILGSMEVEVVDGVEEYSLLMQQIFDFDQISSFLQNDFLFAFDALNAVTGPYAKKILEDILGAPKGTVRNGSPLEDFGGLHPDPNLTYAKDLADDLLLGNTLSFGAACDGDGDRNMILGKGCFVNPSDSLAILTANSDCIPAYSDGLLGVARSMPTSSAVDLVAKSLNINFFETPTGWKFFGNLLDQEKITLCGEESFGTGSSHIREKDGLWAVLYWLQILAKKKVSVSEILNIHWNTFGRHYYSRHDYESIPTEVATKIFSRAESLIPKLVGQSFAGQVVQKADNFSYLDPVDNSLTHNQGLRLILNDDSRVILRMSGTGTQGATLRIYFEKYVSTTEDLNQDPQNALSNLIKTMDEFAEVSQRTRMEKPTVIT